MKVVYISKGDVSVYESQVLELLSFLKGEVDEVILLQGYMSEKEKQTLQEKHSRHTPIKTIWFKSYHSYAIYYNKWIDSAYTALKEVGDLKDVVLHIRGEHTGYLVKRMMQKYNLNIPMLIDVRGVVLEELKYVTSLSKGLKKKILLRIQKWDFNKCYRRLFKKDEMKIKISSVSPLINDYLKKNYPNCNYEMLFHPNIAGRQFEYSAEERSRIRKELGFSDKDIVAICSTAGNAVWQKDYLIVEHLSKMGIKVINLSKNKLGLENVTTMTVKFTDMPAYLSAADIAVLWRDDTFMNNSASPSKFSEFAAMGLYVIHNNSVANAINHISKSGSGILVNDINKIKGLPTAEEFARNRKEWIKCGKEQFGIEMLGKSYIETYRKLIKSI